MLRGANLRMLSRRGLENIPPKVVPSQRQKFDDGAYRPWSRQEHQIVQIPKPDDEGSTRSPQSEEDDTLVRMNTA